ncbi:putative ABC amino acid transporter solute binding protein [Candidatus Moduliflexus flocculans]|uniref:Putative ABC amino acid transporter solute binding protein n=1 Tax=Candidatus Moduliflexus flocculans TaxID=1499966 RepID=A0A0S6VPQ2_9BACT|nr:putative ABC amino acid transporter solute binding protein [Candidatus Moduliflexus flocculans]
MGVFLAGVNAIADDTNITVACSNYPPMYYEKNRQIQGNAYEIAKAVIEKAGLPATFTIMPWKRVYVTGQNEKNFMIVGVGRTARREEHFQWICPINKGVKFYFIKLRSNPISPKSLDEVKASNIVVIRDSHMHEYLLDNGLPASQISDLPSRDQALEFLKAKRADFYLDNLDVIEPGSNELEPILEAYTLVNYLTLSRSTSPEIVQKLQEAYQALDADGKITLME